MWGEIRYASVVIRRFLGSLVLTCFAQGQQDVIVKKRRSVKHLLEALSPQQIPDLWVDRSMGITLAQSRNWKGRGRKRENGGRAITF